MDDKLAIIILAAGMGTRMKSDLAKVLHKIHGAPMIHYVVDAARGVAGENVVVVVGHQADEVRRVVSERATTLFALQSRQLGTGHAVLCALSSLPPNSEDIVILCGDVPLIRSATLSTLVEDHRTARRDATVLAVEVPDPTGYGRIVFNRHRQLSRIVEEADATDAQKEISVINSGIYCVSKPFLAEVLPRLQADNVQKELYLTDIIGIGYAASRKIGVVMAHDYREIMGVNCVEELEIAEDLMAARPMITA